MASGNGPLFSARACEIRRISLRDYCGIYNAKVRRILQTNEIAERAKNHGKVGLKFRKLEGFGFQVFLDSPELSLDVQVNTTTSEEGNGTAMIFWI